MLPGAPEAIFIPCFKFLWRNFWILVFWISDQQASKYTWNRVDLRYFQQKYVSFRGAVIAARRRYRSIVETVSSVGTRISVHVCRHRWACGRLPLLEMSVYGARSKEWIAWWYHHSKFEILQRYRHVTLLPEMLASPYYTSASPCCVSPFSSTITLGEMVR